MLHEKAGEGVGPIASLSIPFLYASDLGLVAIMPAGKMVEGPSIRE